MQTFLRKSISVSIWWIIRITSPPSAREAAMRAMKHETFLKHLESYLETSLKHSGNTLENHETSSKLPWNFLIFETFMKHLWNFYETPLKLPWNTLKTPWKHSSIFRVTFMKHPCNFSETPLKLNQTTSKHHWNFFETPLKRPQNTFETSLKQPL